MAYLHARSGIARSGVTYIGWTPPRFHITIGGTDRTSSVLYDEFSISMDGDGQPSTCMFTAKNFEPALGANVLVYYTTPNDLWFGGTLLQREARVINNTKTIWHCTAVGYQWLIDRPRLYTRRFIDRGVNTIVHDIVSDANVPAFPSDSVFRVGYCPSSLGDMSMEFIMETHTNALQRVARDCGAILEITANGVVNMYETYPDAAYPTVTGSAILWNSLAYREDLSQARTTVKYRCAGSTANGATASRTSDGAWTTSIAVNDTYPFTGPTAESDEVITRSQVLDYDAISPASGAGSLTGVTGFEDYPITWGQDIQDGQEINVLATYQDSTATSTFNGLIGSIFGVTYQGGAMVYHDDDRLTREEAAARGAVEIANFGSTLKDVSFTYETHIRHLRPGRTLTLNISAGGTTITGTFVILRIDIAPYGRTTTTSPNMQQHVTLGPYFLKRLVSALGAQMRIPGKDY